MAVYLTNAELSETLSLQGESFPDRDIRDAIAAASRMLDGLTGRRFDKDTADTTRYYSQPGYVYSVGQPDTLEIDDLAATPTSVAVSPAGDGNYTDAWTLTTHYVLEPKNALTDGQPYTQIRATGKTFADTYPDSLRIVGRFGWPAVPPEIRQATTILAARLLKRAREAAFGVAAIGVEGNGIRVPRLDNDPDVMALVGHLIRHSGAGRALLV